MPHVCLPVGGACRAQRAYPLGISGPGTNLGGVHARLGTLVRPDIGRRWQAASDVSAASSGSLAVRALEGVHHDVCKLANVLMRVPEIFQAKIHQIYLDESLPGDLP
ncbi:hypothetical protein NDU88_002089 [Pleurodeles waltl]|uniref:Uncharacterized protein n=1 Tax=Pleurodeles waltl TaxID=8319 RepID=A0AAV7VBK5_PLEWA|nr:hypothetical protein NDU88_002089 [Pleurodeles waltl]